jgi:uncharacterized protein with FMN-binding domain
MHKEDSMIRNTAPRSVRAGAALVGVAGVFALAGCAGTPVDQTPAPDPGESSDAAPSSSSDSSDSAGGSYADGTYTADGTYVTPESVETISVTVTLQDDIITAVEVSGTPQKQESVQYQGEFIGGIADVVVGEDIDEINVSRVAGSSLTSGGFNDAIETIKAEAAA